jgi:hypothetical protein
MLSTKRSQGYLDKAKEIIISEWQGKRPAIAYFKPRIKIWALNLTKLTDGHRLLISHT